MDGPSIWENWHAFESGTVVTHAYEVPFFTDATIFGQLDSQVGPYHFINTLSHVPTKSHLEPAIIARVKIYLKKYEFDPRAMDEADDQFYHGGDLFDELAALSALILGIRLRPGFPTREFKNGGDPLGDPINMKTRDAPTLSEVANLLADSFGATKKFIDFLIEFLPPPPNIRPHVNARLSFDKTSLRKILRTVYRCRSKALHGGTPFPVPMCEPPHFLGKTNIPAEVPVAVATKAMGAVWHREDAPMHLHIFEYIVQGALKNWWQYMLRSVDMSAK